MQHSYGLGLHLIILMLTEHEDDDEDSTDELFSAPTTSRAKSPRPIVIQKSSSENENFETISTDFTSILDATTSK